MGFFDNSPYMRVGNYDYLGTVTNNNSWFGSPTTIDISGNQTLQNNLNRYTGFNSLSDAGQQRALQALGMQGENFLKTATPDQLKSIVNTAGGIGNNSTFGWSTDQFGNSTFAGGTGLQWAGFGANLGLGLWGAYQQHKQTKLAQQAFEEQKALQRANFRMQAKSYNNSLRNQQSGRGYVGMSGSAKRTLGRDYDARRAEETY